MYFSNCPDVTINYKGNNIISGTKGNISGTVKTNNIQQESNMTIITEGAWIYQASFIQSL